MLEEGAQSPTMMHFRILRIIAFAVAGWICFHFPAGMAGAEEIRWKGLDAQGSPTVEVYYFWSRNCPHCLQAKPWVVQLEKNHSWLKVHSFELSASKINAELFQSMLKEIGETRMAVPAFLFCESIHFGFSPQSTSQIEDEILSCRARLFSGNNHPSSKVPMHLGPISLPWIGEIDPEQFSLPVFTLIIAGVDAFNPCAFFVLLFLLSLMVHLRKRTRMVVVGGIFVFFSGFVYFVFMAAWLNVFLVMGEIKLVTLVAGMFAVLIALFNIKDFFRFKEGFSISIPESRKPGLFKRMTGLIRETSLPSMIAGTTLLAIVANAYEFLCTSGFPMVYTRVLTLSNLSVPTYYFYLVFYNVIYVVPLVLIVIAFTVTLGSRKLMEREGRVLKLMSGIMMLSLGLLLVFASEMLSNAVAAAGLLVLALAATFLVVWIEGVFRKRVRRR
ncbi:MAG: hypothetical protein COV67_08015 [Nitrospinae bacterium CG11_big_fil_rev_8_21_14_0_20_56_8]|nr:MAG: hypothetical protein COV67_08015 [Nitrospinae bacterium CG11_big_fil_rev_8_21_14_0_20_56_8]